MKRFFHLFQFILVIAVTYPLSLLPLRLALRIGDVAGILLFYGWKSRRLIAIENIRKTVEVECLPGTSSPERIARRSFMHLGRSFIELVKIYFNRGDQIFRSVSIQGIEHFREAVSERKGALVITGHYGNWELMALSFSGNNVDISVVARKQNNDYLNSLVERVRRKYNNTVIYKKGALKSIFSRLREGGIVGVLYDQCVLESEGILVDFLCRKAWTMKIPVMISQKAGAPILPIFIRRTDEGHTITVYPLIPPDRETGLERQIQKLNSYIEMQIKDDPAQWLWIHKRWKRTDA